MQERSLQVCLSPARRTIPHIRNPAPLNRCSAGHLRPFSAAARGLPLERACKVGLGVLITCRFKLGLHETWLEQFTRAESPLLVLSDAQGVRGEQRADRAEEPNQET